MSLIEAAVLHERIFCLPATLPDDVDELELRNSLVEDSALTSLPVRNDHNVIGKALVASLSTVEGFSKFGGRTDEVGTPLSFEAFRPDLMRELGLTASEDQVVGDQLTRFEEKYDGELERDLDVAESFDEAARNLIGWLDYSSSGAYDDSMTSFRAMYYVFASEHYRLPHLPSASVQLMQQNFPNYFQASIREEIYQRLTSALRTTVDKVAQDFEGATVFVPPFSALVLHRASTPAEIVSEALALRAEYSAFRRKMHELDHDRLEARSLNDRMKALRQMERLGSEVARPFDQPSQMKLEAVLRYIPDAVDVAANPTNPAGWARLLLNMPTEALISWYRRRPVAKLVRTARSVGALPDYGGLLAKHFGEQVAWITLREQSRIQRI
jgi:hypothetical protein